MDQDCKSSQIYYCRRRRGKRVGKIGKDSHVPGIDSKTEPVGNHIRGHIHGKFHFGTIIIDVKRLKGFPILLRLRCRRPGELRLGVLSTQRILITNVVFRLTYGHRLNWFFDHSELGEISPTNGRLLWGQVGLHNGNSSSPHSRGFTCQQLGPKYSLYYRNWIVLPTDGVTGLNVFGCLSQNDVTTLVS